MTPRLNMAFNRTPGSAASLSPISAPGADELHRQALGWR
jgi:hypothetical protein